VNSIKEASAKGKDLLKVIGDCGDEYRRAWVLLIVISNWRLFSLIPDKGRWKHKRRGIIHSQFCLSRRTCMLYFHMLFIPVKRQKKGCLN
jgi:hypothetical protein